MKYTLTRERLEEMVMCIVQCELSEDEALEYAREFCLGCLSDEVEEVS